MIVLICGGSDMERRRISVMILAVLVVAVVLGTGTGYSIARVVMSKTGGSSALQSGTQTTSDQKINVGDAFGNPDEKTFKDSAEGVLLVGGANGEGSYHVVREGGESQNVYLTSSVLDLGQFVNHKVKVWGETFSAQKAGWLMDVGRLQVLELNAQLPDWAAKVQEKAEQQSGQN